MTEVMPEDPFDPLQGEHPLLQVTPFGMRFGVRDFGDGIVKIAVNVVTFYGDLTFFCDGEDAITMGEQMVAQGTYVKMRQGPSLWTPGD